MKLKNFLLYLLFALVTTLPSCSKVVYAAEVEEATVLAETTSAPAEAASPVEAAAAEVAAAEAPFLGVPTTIVVNRNSCVLGAFDPYNNLVRLMVCSTGRAGHETPLGVYQVYQHTAGANYHKMVDGTYGRYCMRFKDGGYMFHSVCYARPGAAEPILQEIVDLGTPASRGCVRLSVADAEWLYTNCQNGTIVIVTDA